MTWRGIDWKTRGVSLTCALCGPNDRLNVSPSLGWLLFIHAMVDHGLTQDQLDGAHIVVTASGSRSWRLPDGRQIFHVWEPEHLHRERRRRMRETDPLRGS